MAPLPTGFIRLNLISHEMRKRGGSRIKAALTALGLAIIFALSLLFSPGFHTAPIRSGNPSSAQFSMADWDITGKAVVSNFGTGADPTSTAYDVYNHELFVASAGSNDVSIFNGNTFALIATLAVGGSPSAVMFDSTTNEVLVANEATNNVTIIDSASNSIAVHGLSVGTTPDGATFDSANGNFYVSNYGSSTVSVISGTSNQVVGAPITVGTHPEGVAFDSTNGYVYVTDFGSSDVRAINGATEQVVGSPISVGSGPDSITFDSLSGYLFVTEQPENAVATINGATDLVTGSSIAVGSSPSGIAFDQANGWLYTTNEASNNVSIINGTTNSVAVSSIGVGGSPDSITYDPSNSFLFSTNGATSNVTVINGTSFVSEEYFMSFNSTIAYVNAVYVKQEAILNQSYGYASSSAETATANSILTGFSTVYSSEPFREGVYLYGFKNFTLSVQSSYTDGVTSAFYTLNHDASNATYQTEWRLYLNNGTLIGPSITVRGGVRQVGSPITSSSMSTGYFYNYAGYEWGSYSGTGTTYLGDTYADGLIESDATTKVVQVSGQPLGTTCCGNPSGSYVDPVMTPWIGLSWSENGQSSIMQSGYANDASTNYGSNYYLWYEFFVANGTDSIFQTYFPNYQTVAVGDIVDMQVEYNGLDYWCSGGGHIHCATSGVIGVYWDFNMYDSTTGTTYSVQYTAPYWSSTLHFPEDILEAYSIQENGAGCNNNLCVMQIADLGGTVMFRNPSMETGSASVAPGEDNVDQLGQYCAKFLIFPPTACQVAGINTNQYWNTPNVNTYANVSYINSNYNWYWVGN
jgi:YVTN family beta-propeller protein